MADGTQRHATDLVRAARGRGTLSKRSSTALQRPKIIRQIQDALERSYTVSDAGRLLLVTLMPDDSGSMSGHKQDSVILGHNELIRAFKDSAEGDYTMLQTRYLNGKVLNPFGPLFACRELNAGNYPCTFGTPLYEQTIVTLGAVIAKAEELENNGIDEIRTATLIMTDSRSTEDNADELLSEVASVVRDLRRLGNNIVAGMGFTSTRGDTEYYEIFRAMDIDAKYIFPANSRDDILRAFNDFGEEAIGELPPAEDEPPDEDEEKK